MFNLFWKQGYGFSMIELLCMLFWFENDNRLGWFRQSIRRSENILKKQVNLPFSKVLLSSWSNADSKFDRLNIVVGYLFDWTPYAQFVCNMC